MKRHHKITLGTLGTIIAIGAGLLTIVEKSVALMGISSPQREKKIMRNENTMKDMNVKYKDITTFYDKPGQAGGAH